MAKLTQNQFDKAMHDAGVALIKDSEDMDELLFKFLHTLVDHDTHSDDETQVLH